MADKLTDDRAGIYVGPFGMTRVPSQVMEDMKVFDSYKFYRVGRGISLWQQRAWESGVNLAEIKMSGIRYLVHNWT